MKNMGQSMELEDIEIELVDALNVNPAHGSVEFGTTEHTPDQPTY